jgi:hypothetical protein
MEMTQKTADSSRTQLLPRIQEQYLVVCAGVISKFVYNTTVITPWNNYYYMHSYRKRRMPTKTSFVNANHMV